MALKYHRVKRPRRRKNPDAANLTLLISGGVIIASALFIRHMINRPATPDRALPPHRAPVAAGPKPPLDMSKPDARQLEGVGGVFSSVRGLGSL